jgi:hypothetical protein
MAGEMGNGNDEIGFKAAEIARMKSATWWINCRDLRNHGGLKHGNGNLPDKGYTMASACGKPPAEYRQGAQASSLPLRLPGRHAFKAGADDFDGMAAGWLSSPCAPRAR